MKNLVRAGALVLVLVLVLATPAATSPGSPAPGQRIAEAPSPRRVVVLSVPGLTWKDLESPDLPVLNAVLNDSAIANLVTKVTHVLTEPGDAYATMGSGSRAVAPPEVAGQFFDVDAPYETGTAGEAYVRQQGADATPQAQLVALGWTLIQEANEQAEFGGTVGALGELLATAPVGSGVVANAYGSEPYLLAPSNHAEAALTLADTSGALPCGRVNARLLKTDAKAPWGVRLDQAAVLAAVTECSTPSSVVLVEASDLRRALSFRARATPEQAQTAWVAALRATDALIAGLLQQLDPERDALMVVAPFTQPEPGLGVFGIRAREFPPGFLTSGSTRRAGYVLLADVAPTLAALAGVPMTEAGIEGRAMQARPSSLSGPDRRAELVRGEAAALFRDEMLASATLALVIAVSVLALAAAGAWVRRWPQWNPWLARVALALLAFPSLTYLAALIPFYNWGAAAYWLFLIAGSLTLAAVGYALSCRWLDPLALGYGLVAALVIVSVVVLGSRLQFASVFGDSPIVGGRFSGINNVTFAFFFVAGVMLACIAIDRWPGARGRRAMLLILGVVLLVDVAPLWGADVGGALAGIPGLALVATGLGQWKLRWRSVALVALTTLVIIGLLAWFDLQRPSANRSHLGRLFERIGEDGLDGFTTVAERKMDANLRSLGTSLWRFIVGPVAIAAALVVWGARDRVRAVFLAFPALRRAVPGLVTLAVLGYAANDSGIAVPAAMLAIAVPGLIYLGARVEIEEVAP